MKNNRAFVTGGGGFIGSNFIKRAAEKKWFDVIYNLDAQKKHGFNAKNLFDNGVGRSGEVINYNCELSKFKDIYYDTSSFSFSNSGSNCELPSTIVHFAAETHVDRSISGAYDFVESNVVGTLHILEVLKNLKSNYNLTPLLIHVSTDEVYGSLPVDSDHEWTEEDPYLPNSPYAASKAASDLLVRSYVKTYGIKAIITNCSNNYGPRQDAEKMIPKAITNLLRGKKIPVYGTGDNVRDWLHVNDHCDALKDIIDIGVIGEKYNIGGGTSLSNLELVEKIIEAVNTVTGSKYKFVDCIEFVPDRLGHDKKYALSSEKLRVDTNWTPKVDFNWGLCYTVQWYIDNIDRWYNG